MSRIRILYKVCITICILLGIIFRFSNLSWDAGTNELHSDERLITESALRIKFFSHMDPGFQDYNGLSIYVLKAVSLCVTAISHNPLWSTDLTSITLVGRYIGALLSSVSIIIFFIVATLIIDWQTAGIASIIYSLSPLPIQLAHFYTSENYLIFFIVLLALACVLYVKRQSAWNFFLMSLFAGLALASKDTAFLFYLFPALAILRTSERLNQKIIKLLVTALLMLLLFFLGSPYSFLDFHKFVITFRYLAYTLTGKDLYGWTLQFSKTSPLFVFTSILYAFGPLVVIIGLATALYIVFRLREKTVLFLFSVWTLLYTLFVACLFVKYTRYLLLIAPFLALLTAITLSNSMRRWRMIGLSITSLVLGSTILWGLAFSSIYFRPNPNVAASEYLFSVVPSGSVILREQNNTRLPLHLANQQPERYSFIEFDFYRPETPQTISELTDQLSRTDYIVLSSRRVYGTIGRLQKEFPFTNTFYHLLFSQLLGFTHIKTFSSYPVLGPFTVNDDMTEETFAVFDHPKVDIFVNSEKLSSRDLSTRLLQ